MWLAICDDEKESIEKIFQMMKEYIRKHPELRIWVMEYKSPKQFLVEFEAAPEKFDVIFLDVLFENEEVNGLELARRIREKNPNVYLVFLTVTSKYAMEGYKVDAYRYLMKPMPEEEFDFLMDQILEDCQKEMKKTFTAVNRKKCTVIKMKDIFYIEYKKRKSQIHTIDGMQYEHNEPLSKCLSKMDERFCICHRSYIINLDYIAEVLINEIKMKSFLQKKGETQDILIPVSRHRKKNVINYMMTYYARKL